MPLIALSDVVVLFGTAVLVTWLFRILHAPSMLGYLVTGVIIGPSVLQLIGRDSVDVYAQLGLVLLLFLAGLDLSPSRLLGLGKGLVAATALQVFGSALFFALVLVLLTSLDFVPALILGICLAPSSTAILAKYLSDTDTQDTPTGALSVSISVLQDIGILISMILLPLIGASTGTGLGDALLQSGRGLLVMAVVLGAAKLLLPLVLRHVVRPGGPPQFVLFGVLMACGGAWVAALAGWSLALGAFAAGLILSTTQERYQIASDILPFRDVFNALFFISLGMLVDLGEIAPYWPAVIGGTLAVLLLKSLLAALAIVLARWPLSTAVSAGIGLSTVSEFGFVFGMEALNTGMVTQANATILVAVIVGSMMGGTVFIPAAGKLATLFHPRPRPDSPEEQPTPPGEQPEDDPHIIVVGYGAHGQNLVRVLRALHIPHTVIEMDEALLRLAEQEGSPVVMGDATRLPILRRAGLETARALVITADDEQISERLLLLARAERTHLLIATRTSFVNRVDALHALGADVVVADDFETSIEIVTHALRQVGFPVHIIEAQVNALRADRYGMLRGRSSDRLAYAELIRALELSAIQTYLLLPESPACGKSLIELNLRARSGATILAIVRQDTSTTNPPPDFRLAGQDTLVLLGSHLQLATAKTLLAGEPGPLETQPPGTPDPPPAQAEPVEGET